MNLNQRIAELGRHYQVNKIVLFGSRARGDHRERSDIDLAVYGLPQSRQSEFLSDIDDLPTLLEFDIVFVSDQTDERLLQNIERDGITIMNKMQEKLQKLIEAVSRLKEALDDYDQLHKDSIRDGVIQRFEFCTELAWKTVREYLIDQGYTEINSPKAVMKQAFADHVISDETVWLQVLDARNRTSHIYDENTAKEIFSQIKSVFFPAFTELIDQIK